MIGKSIKTLARLSVSLLALWLVLRSVPLQDSVLLKEGHVELTGTIITNGDELMLETVGGVSRRIGESEIALDESGAPQLTLGLSSVWRTSGKHWMLAALALFALVPFLQALRLAAILRAQGIPVSLAQNVKLAFAGNFLNFAAPLGSTAGDVFKAYHVARSTSRRTEAATLVFVDRLIGLGCLLATVAVIAACSSAESRLAPLRTYLIVLMTVGLAAAVAYQLPGLRNIRLASAVTRRIPRRDQIRRVDSAIRALLRQKAVLLAAVGITIVLQTIAAAAFACVAIGLRFDLGTTTPLDFYAYFSSGEIVKAIPGPPQGLGTMELAYAFFFTGMAGSSQILASAFAIRMVNLACALPGFGLVLAGSCVRMAGTAAQRPAKATARGQRAVQWSN